MTSTKTPDLAPEIIDGVTNYLRNFADKADRMGRPEHVLFHRNLEIEDTAGVTAAVQRLIAEGRRVVFYADHCHHQATVVTFYPEGQGPLPGTFGYRTGRKVLASYVY